MKEIKFRILEKVIILNDKKEVIGMSKDLFEIFISTFTEARKTTKNLIFSLSKEWDDILEYFSFMSYSPQVSLLTPLEPVYSQYEIITHPGVLQ